MIIIFINFFRYVTVKSREKSFRFTESSSGGFAFRLFCVFSLQFVPRAFARPVPLARASRQALQRAPRRRLRRSSTRLSHPRARAFERLDGVREFQALFVSERRAARRARDARARAEAQRLKRPRAVALALLRAQRRGVRLRGHYARAGGDRSRRAHAALVRNGAVARARDVEALERARHRDGAE